MFFKIPILDLLLLNYTAMKKILFLTVLFSLMLFSCNDDDNCYTPPEPIVLEFVNKKGENLIQNGTLNKDKIIIQRQIDDDTKTGIFFSIDDYKIAIKPTKLNNGTTNYDVLLLTEPIKFFNFKVNSTELSGKCRGSKIDNILFEDIESILKNGVYQLIIE